MRFTVETNYDQKTLTSLAHALRKTVRKKSGRLSHILGWIAVVLSPVLLFHDGFALDFRRVITLLAVLFMLAVLLFEDSINGWIARKRLLKGLDKSVTTFEEEGYETITAVGKTQWTYEVIGEIVELKNCFVFIFDRSHGQVYDKAGFTEGSVEEFRSFIEGKTKKEVKTIR